MHDLETPMQRPVTCRIDEDSADAGTLADMGVIPEPPTPSIQPFLEPSFPPPEPEDPS